MTDIDPHVVSWVEITAGGHIKALEQVPAGSRIGYAVDVLTPDGQIRELFLQRGGRGGAGSFMGFDREAEVYRALEPLGIPIPHVWGVDEVADVFLVNRARGHAWFQPPRGPQQALSIAQEFMRHLATSHKAGARTLDLPSFGPVKSVREHQSDQLAGIKAAFEAEDSKEPIDALAVVALDYVLHNVPEFDGDPVLVQGDTGPGNFLYEDSHVTAIIDWELAHFGDPMDDIAWLSWRATQHGWPDFPARLREYESASGIIVDPARVQYYRLNACARLGPRFGLADMGRSTTQPVAGSVNAAVDRTADGSWLVMNMLHRRMRLTVQATAMGIELPGREVDVDSEESPYGHLYDTVLDQLKDIVERVEDPVASSLAKGAARRVKYIKELDRHGAVFAAHELDDIGRLLGAVPLSLDDGRARLAAAAREGRVDIEQYLLYHWARLVRDDLMMRPASGAMYDRGWPALT